MNYLLMVLTACTCGVGVATTTLLFVALEGGTGFSILPFSNAGGQQFVIKIAMSKPNALKSRARNLEGVQFNIGIFSA